jgi:hypothetical protein
MKKLEKAKRKIRGWSNIEVSQLKKLFPIMTTAQLAVEFNRSEMSVGQKAHYLGLRTSSQKVWTKAEIAQLKKLFPVMSTREVAKELNRSEKSVNQKAFKMQIKKSKKES